MVNPRKEKAVSNTQKCAAYRKKLNREEYLQKERESKCLHCSKLKADPKAYKKSLKKDRQRKKMKATTPAQSTPTLPQDMEMTPNQGQTVAPNQA